MDIPHLVSTTNGFPKFNPMQEKALAAGLFDQNLVIASPTASGKTVIAELCGLDSILNKNQKAIYLAPLRALAAEHYHDFKQKYAKKHKIRFALSTGDYDSASQYLQKYDMIFATYEKVDSLLRHKADWLANVGLLIVDEVHLLGTDRGPALEMAITKFRQTNPHVRVVCLSATIPNSDQIAKWLSARLVQSDYRPVPLKEGVYFDHEIRFSNDLEPVHATERDSISALVHDTLHLKNKQVLVFASTRPNAQSTAKKLAPLTEQLLTPAAKDRLSKAAAAIKNALEQPTEQCELLSKLVENGVAFHHAGLVEKQRRIVEKAFKKNLVKVICATPTLAAGVNIPAYRVIISSIYRYGETGSERIPVAEYKQMAGRAGRPKYDQAGEAILLSSSLTESDDLLDTYIRGDIEPTQSQLGFEPVLRSHLLAVIATGYVFDLDSLSDFFSKTFYAYQYGKLDALLTKLDDVRKELEEMGFVKSDRQKFRATPLGKRVAELYLDPLSAFDLVNALRKKSAFSPFTYLFLFCRTAELSPYISVPKKIEPLVFERLGESQLELPIDLANEMYADPHLLRRFFTAEILDAWINEKPERSLVEDFNIQPGILHSKVVRCDWLSFCTAELSRLIGEERHVAPVNRLKQRLKYGVREELLVLTQFSGIGRVRARRLWQNNVKSVADLKKIDVMDLGLLIGEETAKKIKQQLGQN